MNSKFSLIQQNAITQNKKNGSISRNDEKINQDNAQQKTISSVRKLKLFFDQYNGNKANILDYFNQCQVNQQQQQQDPLDRRLTETNQNNYENKQFQTNQTNYKYGQQQQQLASFTRNKDVFTVIPVMSNVHRYSPIKRNSEKKDRFNYSKSQAQQQPQCISDKFLTSSQKTNKNQQQDSFLAHKITQKSGSVRTPTKSSHFQCPALFSNDNETMIDQGSSETKQQINRRFTIGSFLCGFRNSPFQHLNHSHQPPQLQEQPANKQKQQKQIQIQNQMFNSRWLQSYTYTQQQQMPSKFKFSACQSQAVLTEPNSREVYQELQERRHSPSRRFKQYLDLSLSLTTLQAQSQQAQKPHSQLTNGSVNVNDFESQNNKNYFINHNNEQSDFIEFNHRNVNSLRSKKNQDYILCEEQKLANVNQRLSTMQIKLGKQLNANQNSTYAASFLI